MIHGVDDSEVLGLSRSNDGIFILMPSMYKSNRKRRDVAQPRCHIGVCRKYCPYKDSPFKVDIVNLMNGKDAVCLLKERNRGEWCSCVVMYLNGKCNVSEKTIEQDVFGFMRRHSVRVMNDDCPLKMEHMVAKWSGCNGKRD